MFAIREPIRETLVHTPAPLERSGKLILELASSLASGAFLGASTPGLEQWFLAWVGMVPFFYFCFRAPRPAHAALLATAFGMGYNLVCLQWYLHVRDHVWAAVFASNPQASCVFSWITMALWQGMFVGAFAYVLRKLPLSAGWLPRKSDTGRWCLPLFVMAPALWILIVDRLCNHPNFLGVPWSMLEYSQYKQIALIQCASLIGGSGIAFCIIVFNLLILTGLGGTLKLPSPLVFRSPSEWLLNISLTVGLLGTLSVYGAWRSTVPFPSTVKTLAVSALQGNLSSEIHRASNLDIAKRYLDLSLECPAGICVWPEWSLPVDWTRNHDMLPFFANEARVNRQTWIVGGFDSAGRRDGRKYNSVGALDSSGKVFVQAYHKRYLVPFGEYVPAWIYHSILMSIFDANHDVQEGVLPGDRPMVFRTPEAAVAPLVCFENCLPQYSAEAVRMGAELLVDSSNTGWFHKSILGDQMVAFSVMRAVENHRPFVFSTLLGPSAIISSTGRILKRTRYEQSARISGVVAVPSDTTLFTRLCRF